jgi:flagellar biosynthetic protein FliO
MLFLLLVTPGAAAELRAANRPPTRQGGDRGEAPRAEAPADTPAGVPAGTAPAAPAGTGPAATGAPGEGQPEGAPDYDYTAPDFGESRVSYSFLVLRTLAVLAILVIVVYLVFRVFLRNRHKIVAGTDVIKVLATYPLAGNKSLQIVEVAGKVLILGITDSNINLITTLEDKETIDRIKLERSKETKGIASFRDQLLKFISGKTFGGQGQISNINEFKERIKKMKKL